MSPTPTDEELSDLSLACQKLWDLDENRLVCNKDYAINVQAGKKSYETGDAAEEPLFSFVNKEVWQKPTYRTFYFLLDNYVAETGVAETVTAEERKENSAFLDAICETPVMQYAHKYLVAKGAASEDLHKFKCQLYQMWFQLYRRGVNNDSCGFEHVFIGESKGDDVTGLHNWIQFFIQEVKKNLDYRGFIKPRSRYEVVDGEDRVMTVQFQWNGELKPVSTMFVGTSPEFEVALYSMVFLLSSERTNVQIDNYDLCIRAYRIASQYGDKIGTCFPELMGETSNVHS